MLNILKRFLNPAGRDKQQRKTKRAVKSRLARSARYPKFKQRLAKVIKGVTEIFVVALIKIIIEWAKKKSGL